MRNTKIHIYKAVYDHFVAGDLFIVLDYIYILLEDNFQGEESSLGKDILFDRKSVLLSETTLETLRFL